MTFSVATRSSVRNRVEAVDDHQGGPRVRHHAEDRVQAVDMAERQHAEDDIGVLHGRRLDRGDLVEVGEQRPVGEHRRPRRTARSGRRQHDRERLGVCRWHRRGGRRPLEELGVRAFLGQRVDPDRYDQGRCLGVELGITLVDDGTDHANALLVGEHDPCPHGRQQTGHLVGAVRGVDRHGDQAGPQGAEVGDRELERVAQRQCDPETCHEPQAGQCRGRLVDGGVELGPGELAVAGDEGGFAGCQRGRAADQFGDVDRPTGAVGRL